MTEFSGISRLQEQQQKTLKNCELMIEKWEKFQEDYTSLCGLLDDLPKKTTHEVMVPVGTLAFMPGQLIHTNEIMVLLGDNWFAERSASQAHEVAQRRLKNVEDYLGNLHQEHENILSHMSFTSDIANVKSQHDFKEIKEELTEKDRERSGQKTKRVARSRATKDSVKRVNLKTVPDTGSSPSTSREKNKDLFGRLDELEKQELAKNELTGDRNIAFEDSSKSIDEKSVLHINSPKGVIRDTSKGSVKRVKWKEGYVEETDIETVAFPKEEKATITFSHSMEKVTPQVNNSIISPADILHDYFKKKSCTAKTLQEDTLLQPRPILKKSNHQVEANEKIFKGELTQSLKPVGEDSRTRRENKTNGKVQEKMVSAFAELVVEHKDSKNLDDLMKKEEKKEVRKISKFKAGRMKTK